MAAPYSLNLSPGAASMVTPSTQLAGTAAAVPAAAGTAAGKAVGGAVASGGADQLAAGIGGIASALSYAGRKDTADFKKNWAKKESGQLGISDAEKRQMLGNAMINSNAQAQAQGDELARQTGAMGFGRSGGVAEATGNIAAAQQAGMGQALGGIETASAQQVAAKDAALKAEAAARKAETKEIATNVAGGALKTAASFVPGANILGAVGGKLG